MKPRQPDESRVRSPGPVKGNGLASAASRTLLLAPGLAGSLCPHQAGQTLPGTRHFPATHKRDWTERLVFRASASCLTRLMLETMPRLRLSCARERDSATPRQTCPKSRSESWQPRSDSSRTEFSRRLSQMSRISAPDSVSPEIWMDPGSIFRPLGEPQPA